MLVRGGGAPGWARTECELWNGCLPRGFPTPQPPRAPAERHTWQCHPLARMDATSPHREVFPRRPAGWAGVKGPRGPPFPARRARHRWVCPRSRVSLLQSPRACSDLDQTLALPHSLPSFTVESNVSFRPDTDRTALRDKGLGKRPGASDTPRTCCFPWRTNDSSQSRKIAFGILSLGCRQSVWLVTSR